MPSTSVRRALQGPPDQPVLVFERDYAAGLDDVWSACTDPDRLQNFFGTFDGDPPRSVGAEFRVDLGGESDRAVGVVTTCEPKTRIAYDWSWQGERTSHVEVTFSAGERSTTVKIVHRLSEPDHVVGYGGGWEQMLAALGAEAGTESYDAAAYQRVEEAANDEWRRLHAAPRS